MTLDERINALTQSIELMASMHKELEIKEQKMREAIRKGIKAYLDAMTEE